MSSTVLADVEKGGFMATTMSLSEACRILEREFENLDQFKLYLSQDDVTSKLVEIVAKELVGTLATSGGTTPPHGQSALAADMINHVLHHGMPTISPFNNNPALKIRQIAGGAPALRFLVEHARMLGEAVLPAICIPSDEVVQAATVVFDDLQLASA